MKIEKTYTRCAERRNLPDFVPGSVKDENGSRVHQWNMLTKVDVTLDSGARLTYKRTVHDDTKTTSPWEVTADMSGITSVHAIRLQDEYDRYPDRLLMDARDEFEELLEIATIITEHTGE